MTKAEMTAPFRMAAWFLSIICAFRAHPVEYTGIHGFGIYQVRCRRCGGLYAMHSDFGRSLLDWDAGFDEVMRERL